MSTLRDPDALIGAWLDDGPQTLPGDTRQAIVVGIRTVPRRRPGFGWPAIRRRQSNRLFAFAGAAAALVLLVAMGLWLWANPPSVAAPSPSTPASPSATAAATPSASPVDLGIFEPVAGWIVYGNADGIWAVDPAGPADPAAIVHLTSEAGDPLGWSADGTQLLVGRDEGLFILQADGSETQLTTGPSRAAIAADGSRVVFTAGTGQLFAVDAHGGPPELLAEVGEGLEGLSFSPDGSQIAYVQGRGDSDHRVWVMDADGTNGHQIVANEKTLRPGHVRGGLAWSPGGDLIAIGLEGSIYTFAPDGSGFTLMISNGASPYWSPDGSQLAYEWTCVAQDPCGGLRIANLDGTIARVFTDGRPGPWSPGAPLPSAAPTATPSAAPPSESPSPPADPEPASGRLGHLAYVAGDGLYIADWDGRNPRLIVTRSKLPGNVPEGCRQFFGGPQWAPDGRHLAVRTDWSDVCGGFLLITDAEGSSLTTIAGSGWNIAWSPDSTRIATWVALWGTIGVYGVDGERQALLPAPRGLMSSGDHDPSWTPDGAAILVPDGVVVPLAGTAPYVDRWLAFPPALSSVSPDGTRIAHVEGTSIVVAATGDGSSQSVLRSLAPTVRSLHWSPTGDRIAFEVSGSVPRIVDVATGATTTVVLPSGAFAEDDFVGVDTFSPDGTLILIAVIHLADHSSSLWSVQADGSGARELVRSISGGDWQWLPPT